MGIPDRNIAEQAYCFFHQKWKVYSGKSSEAQKDDIEYAISSYVDSMNHDLFMELAGERGGLFLHEHKHFESDIQSAINRLECYLNR